VSGIGSARDAAVLVLLTQTSKPLFDFIALRVVRQMFLYKFVKRFKLGMLSSFSRNFEYKGQLNLLEGV